MAFRTVVVDTHSKLEYSLSYLVFRTPDVTKKVLLDEIHTIIIASTAVSLTTSLINELSKRKIKVIFAMKNIIHRVSWFLAAEIAIPHAELENKSLGMRIYGTLFGKLSQEERY